MAHIVYRTIGVVAPHFVGERHGLVFGIVVLLRMYPDCFPLAIVASIEFPANRRYKREVYLAVVVEIVFASAIPAGADMDEDPPFAAGIFLPAGDQLGSIVSDDVPVINRVMGQLYAVGGTGSFSDRQRRRRHFHRSVPVIFGPEDIVNVGVALRYRDGGEEHREHDGQDEESQMESAGAQAAPPSRRRSHVCAGVCEGQENQDLASIRGAMWSQRYPSKPESHLPYHIWWGRVEL